MNNSENNFYKKAFSCIYVEEGAFRYDKTAAILSHFPNASVIPIRHYKDVFNRKNQNPVIQKKSQQLILAVQREKWIYPGASVCQSFGNEHFYYASLMMNCIYDCEYCYLQGMYPSGHLTVFINTEDCFADLERLLLLHPVYLCISFDSDLLAFEGITGYVAEWCEYCRLHPELTMEVRTKSASFALLKGITVPRNLILAWTLTPDYVADNYEHKAPPLKARIKAAAEAVESGASVRLCFDPVLLVPDFENIYSEFFKTVFATLPPSRIKDVSFGEFRVSCDYLKRMRKLRPDSRLLWYPYTAKGGVAGYSREQNASLIEFFKKQLAFYLSDDKIYFWKGADNI